MTQISPAEDRLLTIKEVAELRGLAVGSLHHLAAAGRISALHQWWDESTDNPVITKGNVQNGKLKP
jgi:hypothetical protein